MKFNSLVFEFYEKTKQKKWSISYHHNEINMGKISIYKHAVTKYWRKLRKKRESREFMQSCSLQMLAGHNAVLIEKGFVRSWEINKHRRGEDWKRWISSTLKINLKIHLEFVEHNSYLLWYGHVPSLKYMYFNNSNC